MYFKGKIYKEDNMWLIEVPALDVMTQGQTRKEAFEMIKDAIELHVNKKGFKIKTMESPNNKNKFVVGSNDEKSLIAFLLKRQRLKNGLTQSDMQERLKAKSKTAYSRYEQGNHAPSLEKLEELLLAMNKDIRLSFEISNKKAQIVKKQVKGMLIGVKKNLIDDHASILKKVIENDNINKAIRDKLRDNLEELVGAVKTGKIHNKYKNN